MSAIGFNPNAAALQQMQLVSTLNSVAQNIASGNIEGALQQLVSLYSNMANDPIAQGCMGPGMMGGVQPNFGNYAPPAQQGATPRPPAGQLPQWAQGGGMQVPQQLLQQLQQNFGGVQNAIANAPGAGVGHVEMADVKNTLGGLDLANLMEGRQVNSGEHKGWQYGGINNEQHLKDLVYNGVFEAQAGDGKFTDDELLKLVDKALDTATTEGVLEALDPQEREALKQKLIESLDPFTADNLASGAADPSKPVGPTGPVKTADDLKAEGNTVTTPGGYKLEFEDKGDYYDVKITDPKGNVSYHWGDPHVSESDASGGKHGATDYFWPDKNLSINLPDGTKVSMHATGPQGVIESAEVYCGDKMITADAKGDKIEKHETGGREFDARTDDGTRCFAGPGGDISDLYIRDNNGGWKNINPNEKETFDSLSDFFQLNTPSGQPLKLDDDLKQLLDGGANPSEVQNMQMRRNLQGLLTLLQNATGGQNGVQGYANNAAAGLGQAGVNMQNPMAQQYGQQLVQQQAGFGNPATQFPSYANPAMGFGGGAMQTPGFNPNAGGGAMAAAPGGGGSTIDNAWGQAMAGYDAQSAKNQSKYDDLIAKGCDPAQVAMMQAQEEMQRQNQLMSMMTNLMQIQHDTIKAIIQNLRV